MNTSHSCIPEYPPNYLEYPKFYNAKEYVFILHPGDMLYIPPKWFHWIHSYPDENLENFAVSFNMTNVKKVMNEFHVEKPFIFHLDKTNNKFLNYNSSIFKDDKNKEQKHITLLSKNNIISPVHKETLTNNSIKKELTLNEIYHIKNTNKFNITIGQNTILQKNLDFTPPLQLFYSFPDSTINSFFWLYFIKNKKSYIDSGLHSDYWHNVLIQVKGVKIVRMYSPDNHNNLYIQPTFLLYTLEEKKRRF